MTVLVSYLNDLVARVVHGSKAAKASSDDKSATLRACLLAECESGSDLEQLLELGGTTSIAALPEMSAKGMSCILHRYSATAFP